MSVILPTYNRASYLQRSIRSVLAQTYENFELLIVDDASTDNTKEIVERFVDPRIRFIHRDHNGGAGAARNTGIREARGEFVAFQDSDDEWLQYKLEKQVASLVEDSPGTGLSVCGYFYSTPRGPSNGKVTFVGFDGSDWSSYCQTALLNTFPFGTVTWVARKACLEEAGLFDESMKCWEDWELALRISEQFQIILVRDALFIHHVSHDGIDSHEPSYSKALATILNKHERRYQDQPRVIAKHLYHIGRVECLYHSVIRGREWLLMAAIKNPLNIKAWILFGLSYLGESVYRKIVNLTRRRRFLSRYDQIERVSHDE